MSIGTPVVVAPNGPDVGAAPAQAGLVRWQIAAMRAPNRQDADALYGIQCAPVFAGAVSSLAAGVCFLVLSGFWMVAGTTSMLFSRI